jgi:hypothetical protein
VKAPGRWGESPIGGSGERGCRAPPGTGENDEALAEGSRLKPGGRALAVDFGGPTGHRRSLIEHFHRHGRLGTLDIVRLLREAGLEVADSGPVGVRDPNFVLATAR